MPQLASVSQVAIDFLMGATAHMHGESMSSVLGCNCNEWQAAKSNATSGVAAQQSCFHFADHIASSSFILMPFDKTEASDSLSTA
jgi:hypothetical protein